MTRANPFNIENRTVIVTGAGGGIGLGIAAAFAHAGARVFAVVRRQESCQVVKELVPGVVVIVGDLADSHFVEKIIPGCESEFGSIDILINNAAKISSMPLEETTAGFIDQLSAINLRAPLLLCRDFAESCRSRDKPGKIINIGSIEGVVATTPMGLAAYSATKTAIRGITVSLARELGPDGISVNGVVPGGILHDNFSNNEQIGSLPAEIRSVLENIRSRASAGRLGTPVDIANICLFLASDAADYIRGQTIIADGGYTVG